MAYDGFKVVPKPAKTPEEPCRNCHRRVKLFRDGHCRRCWFAWKQAVLEVTDDAEDEAEALARERYRHSLQKNRREV